MKAVLALISVLTLACICLSVCIAPVGALTNKPSVSSVEETGAKQGGGHAAKGLMSPSPSPTPTPNQ